MEMKTVNLLSVWICSVSLPSFSDGQTFLVGNFSYAQRICNDSSRSLFPSDVGGSYITQLQKFNRKRLSFGTWMYEEILFYNDLQVLIRRRQNMDNVTTEFCEQLIKPRDSKDIRRQLIRGRQLYFKCIMADLDLSDIAQMLEYNLVEQHQEYLYDGFVADADKTAARECAYMEIKTKTRHFRSCKDKLEFRCYDKLQDTSQLFQTISINFLNDTTTLSVTSEIYGSRSDRSFDAIPGGESLNENDGSSSSVAAAVSIPIVLIVVVAIITGVILLKRYTKREDEYLDVQTRPATSEHQYAVPTLYKNVHMDSMESSAAEPEYYNSSMNSVHYVNTETTNKMIPRHPYSTDEEPQELYDNVDK